MSKVSPAPVYRVPLLNTDVHDLDGLGTIADLLFAGPSGGRNRVEGPSRSANLVKVRTILVASDAPSVRAEVAAIAGRPDVTIREARSGPAVMAEVAESVPDLVVVDLQMGNMGGMAVCLELRLEASYDKLGHVPVLMLLDRRPDVFLARRSGAEGWVVKPLDPIRLRAGDHLPPRRWHLLRRVLPAPLCRVHVRTCRHLTARPDRQRHHRVRVPTQRNKTHPIRVEEAVGRPTGGSRPDGAGLDGRQSEGGADAQEQFIIDALNDLHDTVVREVMTPRVDVVALSIPLDRRRHHPGGPRVRTQLLPGLRRQSRRPDRRAVRQRPVPGRLEGERGGTMAGWTRVRWRGRFVAGRPRVPTRVGTARRRDQERSRPRRTGSGDGPTGARTIDRAGSVSHSWFRSPGWFSTSWPRCDTSDGPSPWSSTSTVGSRGC